MARNNRINTYLMRVDEKGGKYQGYMFDAENIEGYAKQFVGGDMKIVALRHGIVIISRQDAVILGSPLNRAMYNESGELVTVFSGNIMAVRQSDGGFASIRSSDIGMLERSLKPIARIYNGTVFTEPASALPRWGITESRADR